MPDIDSLPLVTRMQSSNDRHSPSPRASNASLAAAATINAGIQYGESRQSSITSNRGRPSPQSGNLERRRSSALLSSLDPSLPAPGELQSSSSASFSHRTTSPQGGLGSPIMTPRFRDRAPSLGELHQELEFEQEAQVNRLLGLIRQQEQQLQALQQQIEHANAGGSSTGENATPSSERSTSYPYPAPSPQRASVGGAVVNPRPHSPTPRTSIDLSRRSSHRSRTNSRTSSPFRPASASLQLQADAWAGERSALLDDVAFYQHETQNLTRENQMLRHRIRDLERQLNEVTAAPTNSPPISSNLVSATRLEAGNREATMPTSSNTAAELEPKEDSG